MIKLRIRDPEKGTTELVIEGNQATIGRGSGEVTIPHPVVSNAHAMVIVGVAIIDLGSTNGVWIDGQRLTKPRLITPKVSFQLGGDATKSPSVEILETSLSDSTDALEKQHLRERIAALEAEVERLRAEAEQRRRVEAEVASPAPPPPVAPPPPAEPSQAAEPSRPAGPPPAQPESSALPSFAEFFGAYAPPADDVPAAPASAAPRPAPARQVAHGSSANRQAVLDMIDRLVREDVGEQRPMIEGPVEQFFTLESFRLLRQVEKVISRVARDFVQLYEMKTMLPGEAGNFRSLAADVLIEPNERLPREKLVEYLEELNRWLGVSLMANRHSALKFVHDLRKELSSEGLIENRPIPAVFKLLGRERAELWRRAERRLRELTDNVAEDRLEDYVREFVDQHMAGART